MNTLTRYTKLSRSEVNDLYIQACQQGNFDGVRFLLTQLEHNKANINYKNGEGFSVSCYYGYMDIVKYLRESKELEQNIILTEEKYRNSLDLTIIGIKSPNKIKVFEYLLSFEEFINVTHDCRENFRKALFNDNFEVIRYLITEKNIKREEILSTLIEYGDNPTRKSFVESINNLFKIKQWNRDLEKELSNSWEKALNEETVEQNIAKNKNKIKI